jgi:HSP20 family protein
MDPIKKLRLELERGISRAFTEGWREVLTRSSGALTQYVRAARQGGNEESNKTFPTWALLAGECWETAQSVIVRIELPGMRKEDIHISIDHGRLRIRGIKRSSGEDEPRFYHLMERAFGSFERSSRLRGGSHYRHFAQDRGYSPNAIVHSMNRLAALAD